MSDLAGRKILVVEDEFLVAMVAEEALTASGAVVLGPASTVAEALRVIESEAPDAALLDVNLKGVRSDPVAEALQGRGVPFILATGYGQTTSVVGAARILDKPYTDDQLIDALARLFRK